MPKVIDATVKERFIELRANGVPYSEIEKELGVSKPTLMKYAKEFELEISNLHALQMQSLFDQHYVTKEKRVQLLGEELNRLEEEIQKREYSEMSLKELVELKLKYADKLKGEEVPLMLQDKADLEDSLDDLISKNYVTWKA